MSRRPPPRSADSPFDRRFVFVTGKGGVGKTSVAASIALSSSRRGRNALLATTDPARYRDLLPAARWTNDPTLSGPGLWVVHLTPDAALEEYGQLLIKPRLARRALFANRYVQGFLRAIPGLRAWAVLGKAWYHVTQTRGEVPRFDTVVLDAPATGHGLSMLRVPRVITQVAPGSLLRRDAEAAWRLFQNRDECCIALVTLPEELPTNEAEELAQRIERELALPLGCIVANHVVEPLFDATERQALASLKRSDPGLRPAVERAVREAVQESSLSRLEALNAPLVRLPEIADGSSGPALLEALADALEGRPRTPTSAPDAGEPTDAR